MYLLRGGLTVFARRFASRFLPAVEDALAHVLQGAEEGEWEVVILNVSHPRVGSPETGFSTIRPLVHPVEVWADETPTIRQEVEDDGA